VGEGIEAARQALKSELDLNIDDLMSIPEDQFIKYLQEDRQFGDDHLEKLADIFFLIAEELGQKSMEDEKIKKLFGRSLTIYQYLDRIGSTYSFERHEKIGKIKQSL
jgi:hypothetical protein